MNKLRTLLRTSWTSIVIAISLVSGIIGANLSTVHATTDTVGSLVITYTGSASITIFNAKPGDAYDKVLTVANVGTVSHSFAIGASSVSGGLADVFLIEPQINGTSIWQKTLTSLAGNPNVSTNITTIAPGATQVIDIIATLPASTGNAYQGLSLTNFTLQFGSETTDLPEPTPPPTPTISNATTAPQAPATPPATLTARTQGLIAPTPTPTIGGSITNAAEPQVSPSPSASPTGSVKGVSTAAASTPFWWWILSLIMTVFLIVYYYLGQKRKLVHQAVWPLVIAVLLFIARAYLLRTHAATSWYTYFPYVVIIELILYYIAITYRQNPTD